MHPSGCFIRKQKCLHCKVHAQAQAHAHTKSWKETLSISCICVKESFSIRKVTLGQAFFGSCCFFISRLKQLRANHTTALFPPYFPTSMPAGHPMAAPGQGKTGLRNSLLHCHVPTADPLLHMKQDSPLIIAYPTLNGWIYLAPSRAGGQVSLLGHPSVCLRWVIFQRCPWTPPNQST